MNYITKVLISGLFLILVTGCISPLYEEVIVKNAYCDLDNNFTFILENIGRETLPLDYAWALIDPMSNEPVYSGEGSTVLRPHELKELTVEIDVPFNEYGFYATTMEIHIYKDGREIYRYRDYKSPYEWNYSVTPPIKHSTKPGYVSINFGTFIQRNEKGDFVIHIENVTFHPASSSTKLLIPESYLILGDNTYEKEWRVSHLLNTSTTGSEPVFVDNDGDGCISDFDYFIVPGTREGLRVRLNTANQFIDKTWYWREETLKEEDRDAIRILNITPNPLNPQKLNGLEFIIEVRAKHEIEYAGIFYVPYPEGTGGSIGGPFRLISRSEDVSTYSTVFEGYPPDYDGEFIQSPNLEVFYIDIRDSDDNELAITYEVTADIP